MEKNISEIKGLAKEVFNLDWFAKGITRNGGGSILIWNKGLIPKAIAKIIPGNDTVYIMGREYEDKIREFARQYEARFLSKDEHMSIKYPSTPTNALFLGEVQI